MRLRFARTGAKRHLQAALAKNNDPAVADAAAKINAIVTDMKATEAADTLPPS